MLKMKVDCALQSMSFTDDHSGGEDEDDFHLESNSSTGGTKSERKVQVVKLAIFCLYSAEEIKCHAYFQCLYESFFYFRATNP